ncbi:hypothetical protein V8D89_002134 [Ganoderma adspersum]
MDIPHLDCAFLRGDHFLAHYLLKEDEAAVEYKQDRTRRDSLDAPNMDEPTYFHCATRREV